MRRRMREWDFGREDDFFGGRGSKDKYG